MLNWEVIEAKVIEHGRLHVRFADGLEGQVRFLPSAYSGVFSRLLDPNEFKKVKVNCYFVTSHPLSADVLAVPRINSFICIPE
jgi:hypothetical protein